MVGQWLNSRFKIRPTPKEVRRYLDIEACSDLLAFQCVKSLHYRNNNLRYAVYRVTRGLGRGLRCLATWAPARALLGSLTPE